MFATWAWDVNHIIATLAVVLLLWWVIGRELNRRRTRTLVKALRKAMPALGSGGEFRPVGNSAFQITLTRPAAPFQSVHLLCLLEAREYPLAQLWTRLRGRYDQLILRADFATAPQQKSAPTAEGVERVTLCALQPATPHLQLSFAVPPGREEQIARAFAAAAAFARGAAAS